MLTQYSDFSEVDGVLFPFREENFPSGIPAASTTLHKIQIDPSENEPEFPVFMHGPSGEVAARHLYTENASDIVETSKCIPEIRGRGFFDG